MVQDTISDMGLLDPNVRLERYEPSQEHGPAIKLALPLNSPLNAVLRDFAAVENRPIDARAMASPRNISTYFCILHDRENHKLVGIRRSAQFKAVLGARLIQFIDDSFRAVSDRVFRLDHDFDLVIVDDTVFINRVSAFELLAEVDEAVQQAALENTRQLEQTLPFIEFNGISDYVAEHKRSARIVAALRSRADLADTTVANLRRECRRSGVKVHMEDGKLVPELGQEMTFLQTLDRRRYALMLVDGRWEQYEAASRKAAGIREDEHVRRAPATRARQRGARRRA